MNDEFDLRYVKVSKTKLNAVENIVAMARGRPNFIDGDKDWEIVFELFKLWYYEYPEQYDEFQKSVSMIRKELINKDGMFKDKGTDLWQRQLEVPITFYNMIKAIYPEQKWDTKFVSAIAKRLPILKVADKI